MSEISRLELLKRLFGAGSRDGVRVGIGDDAAVLEAPRDALVWTVDAAVEGVHFLREIMTLEDIGWRSLTAAASDLAAMGARPRGVLCALILPPAFDDTELEALARGQAEAAAALGTAVVGGNLSRGAELSISTTVIGEARRPLLRSGALAGDVLGVAGSVGLAAAGLAALRGGVVVPAPALRAFRRPVARIAEGLAAAASAHAAIDVSDGLALDASRIASESGVGVELDVDALLRHAGPDLLAAALALGKDPLELVLHGGEDYALLAALTPGTTPATFAAIGCFVDEAGVFLRKSDGTREALAARGFDHFGQ